MSLLKLFFVSVIVIMTGKAPFSVGFPVIVNLISFSLTVSEVSVSPGGNPETLTDSSG